VSAYYVVDGVVVVDGIGVGVYVVYSGVVHGVDVCGGDVNIVVMRIVLR